ncbi:MULTISPECIES: prolyl oligopeptidase family serine peptidase [Flavobacterium]|uniref:S9 family peptidase n=1 Tax=Flavobacterium TaxID=237 RepID=UPI0021138F58|nr:MULTISPECIES: prolyl oligopeptidase family serine peptidase [Flavobacterium]UUF12596.1 prolyl oligopeptidase family serine peptidase [Flavobacterium panici]
MIIINYTVIKKIFHTTLILVLFFILQLVACPVFGQAVQKRQLKEEDYELMGNMNFHNATTDAKWCSYSMTYNNGSDTLFVQNIKNKTRYAFPSASMGKFTKGSCFSFLDANGLHVINLISGHHDVFQGVKKYSMSDDSNKIAAVVKGSDPSQSNLLIIDKTGKIIQTLPNVTEYIFSPGSNQILFIEIQNELSSLGIMALDVNKKTDWIIRKNPSSFKSLTWEKNDRSVCFFYTNLQTDHLCYYMISEKKLYYLDQDNTVFFPKDKKIDFSGAYSLLINSDQNRVFFGIQPRENKVEKQNSQSDSNVEIWNGNDKWIYPFEQFRGRFEKRPNLAVWFPLTGIVKQLSSPELPSVMLTADQQFVVLSDPKQYEPQFDYFGPRDFIVKNVITGDTCIFLQKLKINSEQTFPVMSPGGSYISYTKDSSCWIYDIRSKTHTNITEKIYLHPDKKGAAMLNDKYYPPAGWTPNDKEVILYDEFDLWLVSVDGKKVKRLTKGREKEIQFRIAESSFRSGLLRTYDGWIDRILEPEKGLLLQARGLDYKTGFYKWKKDMRENVIEYKDSYIDKLYSAGENSYFFVEQKFDLPPRLMFKRSKTLNVVNQSNPQYVNFQWGSNSLIDFSMPNGLKQRAVLYYPAQYDPSKKYPMIVNVYEKKAKNIYNYQNPTLQNPAGFNLAVLTSLGYFVLCPDIFRINGNEGPTALITTVAAVNEVKAKGLITPNKIGIIGHSFGGYETDFVIANTDIFAAAVSGAAVTNTAAYYHTVNWQNGVATMNYFTSGQFRADLPPSQIPEVFSRNSPITNVGNITTPLLSFAGKKDYHVNWNQSLELYMAMRRLGKKNILLLYPDEGHALNIPENQIDFTKRVCQWFGYYLKDENPAEWIEKGIL